MMSIVVDICNKILVFEFSYIEKDNVRQVLFYEVGFMFENKYDLLKELFKVKLYVYFSENVFDRYLNLCKVDVFGNQEQRRGDIQKSLYFFVMMQVLDKFL